jgi:hypothetical protein
MNKRTHWFRMQMLRALGLDPDSIAALRKAAGVDGNLSQLRKAALRSHGIDPFDVAAMQAKLGGAVPPPTKPKPARSSSPKAPRVAKAPRVVTPRVPKIQKEFSAFLKSGCKNLQLAAKVLGIAARPPLRKSVLRTAWIELIGKHHPDKGGNVEAAQAVNAAYQLLVKFAS